MKRINTFIIIFFVIALLINPVFGFPGLGGNNSDANSGNITQNDLANTTQSDQNIILIQHLIEVDAAQLEGQNKLYVRETIVFKNIGDMSFQGTLRTWVPDGSEEVRVVSAPMIMGGTVVPINSIRNGNIISWQDIIRIGNQPFSMYAMEYSLPAKPEGSFSKSRYYTKKFVFPTLITKVPLNVVIKVTKGKDENVIIRDEKGSNVQSSGTPMEDNSVLYNIETPQFKEINIEFSKPAIDLSQIAPYLIIGLLIVLVLAYPTIRKKSPKLQEIEGKIRNSLKRETASDESEETDEEVSEEESSGKGEEEESPEKGEEEEFTPEDENLSGKSKDELETEKNELLSKLENLEKDYSSGDLIDEEYEELRNSYQERLKKIERRIE